MEISAFYASVFKLFYHSKWNSAFESSEPGFLASAYTFFKSFTSLLHDSSMKAQKRRGALMCEPEMNHGKKGILQELFQLALVAVNRSMHIFPIGQQIWPFVAHFRIVTPWKISKNTKKIE